MKLKRIIFAILVFVFGITSVYAQILNTDDIDRKSYVIGTHLFNGSGGLTIHHIMVAAKTIEGDDIDDMVIYYKNARGNWVDGYSGEAVTAPNSFEIAYINLEPQVYVPKPTLINASLEYANEGDVTLFEDGEYTYFITVDPDTYDDLEDDVFYELYVKDDEDLEKIGEDEVGELYEFNIKPGALQTLVAKAYILDGDEKIYSTVSNELIVGTNTLTKPVIRNEEEYTWNYSHPGETYVPELVDGVYHYDIGITNVYGAYWQEEGLDTPAYEPEGYYAEIYAKVGDEGATRLVSTVPLHAGTYPVTVKPGEKKIFTIKVFALASDNTRLYSDPSNEVEIDHSTITVPVLRNNTLESWNTNHPDETYIPELVDGKYVYQLNIDTAAYKASGEENPDPAYFYEIHAVGNGQTTLVTTAAVGASATIYVEPGENKTYKARVCLYDADDNKVCSNYSNEINIDRSTITVPTLHDITAEILANTYDGGHNITSNIPGLTNNEYTHNIGVEFENYLQSNTNPNAETGYYVIYYEKVNGNYVKINDEDVLINDAFQVTVEVGTKRTFVAKIHALGANVSADSDYSDELEIDHTTIATPELVDFDRFQYEHNHQGLTYQPTFNNNGQYLATFKIMNNSNDYSSHDDDSKFYYRLYRKLGETETVVSTGQVGTASEINYSVIANNYDEDETYFVKIYTHNKSGDEIVSAASDEISLGLNAN